MILMPELSESCSLAVETRSPLFYCILWRRLSNTRERGGSLGIIHLGLQQGGTSVWLLQQQSRM